MVVLVSVSYVVQNSHFEAFLPTISTDFLVLNSKHRIETPRNGCFDRRKQLTSLESHQRYRLFLYLLRVETLSPDMMVGGNPVLL
jgi:hypothetical protein